MNAVLILLLAFVVVIIVAYVVIGHDKLPFYVENKAEASKAPLKCHE